MNVKRHIELLGMTVCDKVTGFTGVITSVSFDLYGCLQCIVTPRAGDDGKIENGSWFDANRLQMLIAPRVMDLPPFDYSLNKKGMPTNQDTGGPAYKPVK